MNIYFHASIRQRPQYGKYYERIVEVLKNLGHKVDATHALHHEMDKLVEEDTPDLVRDGYSALMKRITWADVIVCEVSYPSSIVVGNMLARALERGKPVLGLYHEDTTAALLTGMEIERFLLTPYSDVNLESVLKNEMKTLLGLPDQRFTMLLPGNLVHYLDEIAETGLSRSEFIRELIREHREKGNK
jgi:hypothetical protein